MGEDHATEGAILCTNDDACLMFELIEKLGAPYYAFHDRDVAPEGATLAGIPPESRYTRACYRRPPSSARFLPL